MTPDRRLYPRVPMGGRAAALRTAPLRGRPRPVHLLDLSLDGVCWSSDDDLDLFAGTEVALSLRLARLLGPRLMLSATVVRQRDGYHAARFAPSADRNRLGSLLERARVKLAPDGRAADHAAIARAIRQLALTFDKGVAGRPRLLLVTSPRPWEGKSFVAAGVAAAAAAAGQRVLLVDADFHAPTQHLVFGVKGTPGLAQLLATEGAGAVELLQSTRHGVTMLAAGSSRAQPALVGPAAIDRTFGTLRTLGFGLVVLDTPAILASADALTLGRYADDVLVAARAGSTRESDLRQAIDLLRRQGAPVSGVVLNDHLDVALGGAQKPAAMNAGVEPLADLLASMASETASNAELHPVLT